MTLAFLTEFMARQDKLGADSMRKVLPKAARRKQTLAEQRVVVKEIQNRYGLTPYFRPHPRRTEAR